MNRETLIAQVKEEYANIASAASQQHFQQTTTEISPEAYYENLLNAVVTEIGNGMFDTCRSGTEIVNKVATDKSILSELERIEIPPIKNNLKKPSAKAAFRFALFSCLQQSPLKQRQTQMHLVPVVLGYAEVTACGCV